MTKRILVTITLLISAISFAQKYNATPYSFFGIGDQDNTKTVSETSRGGYGVTGDNFRQLNFTNPATYSNLQFTIYEIAGENRHLNLSDAINAKKGSITSVSYLAIGFPLSKKAGFAFGLQPTSSVGYSFLSKVKVVNDVIKESNLFFGNGGTNRLFFGLGYKVLKNLSVGLEGAYKFGNITNAILNRRDSVQLASQYETVSNVKGFNLKAGFQYKTPINKKIDLNLGGVFTLSNTLSNNGREYLYSLVNNNLGAVLPRDTIVNRDFKSTIANPVKSVIGVSVGEKYKWSAGIEYGFQNALDFKGSVFDRSSTVSYEKSNRIYIGGFYLPDFNSITSYWKRVTYSAGIKYMQTGLRVNNTSVNDYGISFGVALPMGKKLSLLNLGFDLGRRGTTNNGLVKEKYANFRVGLTLNDKWFNKRKIQ